MTNKDNKTKIDTTPSKKFALFMIISMLSLAVALIGVHELYQFYKRRTGVEQAYIEAPDYVAVLYGEPLMLNGRLAKKMMQNNIASNTVDASLGEGGRASPNFKYPYHRQANQEQASTNNTQTDGQPIKKRSILDFLKGR